MHPLRSAFRPVQGHPADPKGTKRGDGYRQPMGVSADTPPCHRRPLAWSGASGNCAGWLHIAAPGPVEVNIEVKFSRVSIAVDAGWGTVAIRGVGYVAAALVASFVYLSFTLVPGPLLLSYVWHRGFNGHVAVHVTPLSGVLLIWLLVAFGIIGLMFPPWRLILWVSRQLQIGGPIYFALCGAIVIFVIGVVLLLLIPKPSFIEDHTFLEEIAIVADRQGLSLMFSGLAWGLMYWLVSERKRQSSTL
jgi:hypothetical protein